MKIAQKESAAKVDAGNVTLAADSVLPILNFEIDGSTESDEMQDGNLTKDAQEQEDTRKRMRRMAEVVKVHGQSAEGARKSKATKDDVQPTDYSDVAQGKVFARLNAGKLFFNQRARDNGGWYWYDGTRWVPNLLKAQALAQELTDLQLV